MSMPILLLVPLIVLGIVLLFPFVGCTGEDPYLTGKAEGEKIGEAKGIPIGIGIGKQEQGEAEAADEDAQKYPNVVGIEPDLISYWRLSEGQVGDLTAVDSAPAPVNKGLYMNPGDGGVNRAVDGILALVYEPGDRAAAFDGVKGFVEVPHDLLINPPLDFSIEAWLRPEPGTLTFEPTVVVGSYEVDASGSVIRGFVVDVFVGATGPRVRARVGNVNGHTLIEAGLGDGSEHDQWRHVVVTYSAVNKELKLYVNADDGTPDATLPGAGGAPVFYVANASTPLRIAAGLAEPPAAGPAGTAAARFFKGRVDEVALYRVPLDGGRVKAHFQSATSLIV